MKAVCVVLLVVAVGFARSQMVPVPAGSLPAVQAYAVQAVNEHIKSLDADLNRALQSFKPVNQSCQAQINTATKQCEQCVIAKCEARAKDVCKPEQWQIILGKTVKFFSKGIPDFFTKSIPDIFVNKIGGGVVDITKDVGNFFTKKIGGGIIDTGNFIKNRVVGIGKKVVDVGKKIGNGVVNIGKTIGGGIVDVGKKIGDIGKGAINGIKNIGSKIGNAFKSIGSIFGKRDEMTHSEFIRARRSGEPGCTEFENDPEKACQTYVNSAYCPVCGFNPMTNCAGYKVAADAVNTANGKRTWMSKIQQQNFDVLSITFNPTAIDISTGNFKIIDVQVNIFTRDFTFRLNQPSNPYIPNIIGRLIGNQALELFKSS